jgi:cation diffusion facilitator CzcD-associated flavoprotein CzcO
MAEGDAGIHAALEPGSGGDTRHFDVLIIGAGLSGIGAACQLQTQCPAKSFAILEARDVMGGTWDLFRYPGIRSDSDMFTMGYSFRPWPSEKAISDGPSILKYIKDTAAEHDVDRKIRYGHRVTSAAWSTVDALWTVEAEVGPERTPQRFTGNFLYMCSGYYDYDAGYTPGWPEMERYRGRVVHPQHWPEDLAHAGRRVVVIGSGATAVTLVPEMAKTAAHVTMLQRSPTYVVSRPARDAIAARLQRWLPARVAHGLTRWKNVLLTMYFYRLSQRRPTQMKDYIVNEVRKALGPDYDVAKHFTPRYNPWDQRMCLIPDADLFDVIRTGKASVVTDEIEGFTETGIKLRSGEQLDADIIVTATGLKVKMMGGMRLAVDGTPVEVSKRLIYKGMMLNDVPNVAFALGYTNASWTLKCELTSAYVCRLLNHMAAKGHAWCMPHRPESGIVEEPAINFSSGYIQRASGILPKQGSQKPWKLHQNYALDLAALRFATIEDGTIEFGPRTARGSRAA